MGCLLGIDAGTTSTKVGVFADDGTVLGVGSAEYSLHTPAPDRVEFDAARYWEALVAATAIALKRARIHPADVAGIAVSSQGETLVPVAADGSPMSPAIVWLDNRATAEAGDLADTFDPGAIYEATGVPVINPTWPAAKLLWWKRHEPTLFAGAARFLLLEDFLLHHLTGRFVSDGGVQCTSLLYDIRTHDWWPPMLEFLGLSEARLPDLVRPGEPVGTLRAEAAEALGLPRRVTVVAGGMDQGAGAVGVGNVGPGIVSESTGGALTLQASVDRPDGDATRRTPVYVHSAPGRYLYCPVCPTGGMVLTWFRDRFGHEEVNRAALEGRDPYDLLTELAAGVPPGSDGLTMLPHLAGAFSPEYEPRARGVYVGFTLSHGKPHFVRAILEAVAFMLCRNLELLGEAGAVVNEVRSHGGGARSALWCQIKADVCGVPVVTLHGEEAAVRGDAILAGVAIGSFRDLAEACDAMIRVKRRYLPDPRHQVVYAGAYRRYIALFDALRPLFEAEAMRTESVTTG